ncbi:MAG TPA: DUF4139 domain-containing protein [bacterium]|nr:DUF4139 domain-containing protein [bacterium]HOL46982.1 DUF4139 domain-containing protein [bacterium]HPQ19022.1 DUF4139 domain-containing protein [bacterium]
MKNFICYFLLFFSVIYLYGKNDYEITIYNNDLGLVKTKRFIKLEEGIIDYKFEGVSKFIDPTSLCFYSQQITVLEQNYQFDLVSYNKLLEKYLGKEITIVRYDDKNSIIETKKGNLLSIENNRISVLKVDDKLELYPDGKIILPELPEGLLIEPTLLLKLKVQETKEHPLELIYLTKGFSWYATYNAVINKTDDVIDLNGWVTLTNTTGIPYEDASLKLVAGDVNVVREQFNRRVKYAKEMALAAEAAEAPPFEEQQLFEYHLYKLDRRTTIKNNETKQILFLTANNITTKKKFVYDPAGYKYKSNSNNQKNAGVVIVFNNNKTNNLGMPLPAGKIRFYKTDNDGQLQFLGENKIEHTPEGETISLVIGNAFEIVLEKKLIKSTSLRNSSDNTFTIDVRNQKNEDVIVYCVDRFYNNWEIKKSNFKYEKIDAFTVEFVVPVKAKEKEILEYNVYSWWTN